MNERTSIVPSRDNDTDEDRAEFIAAWKRASEGLETLQGVVIRLIDDGYEPADLVAWGTEAGYSEHALRKTISLILLKRGVRRRASGGGPKPPMEAEALAAEVVAKYSESAPRILLAAYRIATAMKKELRLLHAKERDRTPRLALVA